MSKNLITQAAYAKLVGVSLSTITSRVASGTIETRDIGGVRFIDVTRYPPDQFEKSKGGRPKLKKGNKKHQQ